MSIIQVVTVLWGTRYPDAIIDHMRNAILTHTNAEIRFVCITDHALAVDPVIKQVPFPDFAHDFEALKSGCRLKLAIFAEGILEPNLPTLFFDLDTAILGDVAKLAAEIVQHPKAIHMLRNHYLQWWRLPFSLRKLLLPNRYYFGNSSVIGFYPKQYCFIFDRFKQFLLEHRDNGTALPLPKFFRTDERFVSYSAAGANRVFPPNLVEKFAEEYMLPFVWMEELRRHLPWVKARRAGQVAITFVGNVVKPSEIAQFRHGQIIKLKRLRIKWRHENFQEYYAQLK